MNNKTNLFNLSKPQAPTLNKTEETEKTFNPIIDIKLDSNLDDVNSTEKQKELLSSVKPFDIVSNENRYLSMAIFNLDTKRQIGWLHIFQEHFFQVSATLYGGAVKGRSDQTRWAHIKSSICDLLSNMIFCSDRLKNLISNVVLTQIIECVFATNYSTGEYLYTEIYKNNNRELLQRLLTIVEFTLRHDRYMDESSEFYFSHLLDLESIFKVSTLDKNLKYIPIKDRYENYKMIDVNYVVNKQTKEIYCWGDRGFDVDDIKNLYLYLEKVHWFIYTDSDDGLVIQIKVYSEEDLKTSIKTYLEKDSTNLMFIDEADIIDYKSELEANVYKKTKPQNTLVFHITKSKMSELITPDMFIKLNDRGYTKKLLSLISNGLMTELEFKHAEELNVKPEWLGLFIEKVTKD